MLGMVITLSNDAAWSMETEMIEVYAFATPNSVKAPIALEEMGLAYASRLPPVPPSSGPSPVSRLSSRSPEPFRTSTHPRQ
jgi:hypothetical protein